MRIAVTFENGEIFQHFGHSEQFKIYDIENGKITATEIVDTNESGHGALAGVLNALKVDVLICGGIGGGARAALDAGCIKLYGGISGSADAAVEELIAGRLSDDPEACCDHHNHREEPHNCGQHGHCHGDHEHHSCG